MTTSDKWLKITFACPHEITEPVSDLVVVTSGVGVNIRPVQPGGHDEVSGYFKLDAGKNSEKETLAILRKVTSELTQLFELYRRTLPELKTEILNDQDWATCWQKYFTPFEIIPGLVIKPSWEEYTPEEDQYVLEMDPGMAFGTGQHASTRLALSLIASWCKAKNDQPSGKVLDVGTGTGILAMAAAVFGARNVTAIDNDSQAVEVAQANIRNNDLHRIIRVSSSPLADVQGSFDLICANIIHDVLVAMAPDFRRLLAPGGHVVLAGILQGEQEKNIEKVFRTNGMDMIRSKNEEEWTAMLLVST